MSIQTRRLGRGLDALIPDIMPNTGGEIQSIPLDKIKPNPYQPRQIFDPESLTILAESIKKHGLTQPIIVREIDDHYEIIVGERRVEATKLIGHATIPAIIKNITNKESCEVSIVENIDRENLNAIEIAYSFKRLIDEFEYSQETLSQLFSRSRSSIANILRLIKLPKSVQKLILSGQLSEGHGRQLIDRSSNEQQCLSLAETIINNKLTVRQTEQMIKRLSRQEKPKSKQLNLFDHYKEQLSEQFNGCVDIKHSKNKLTISVQYNRFKDYIELLDRLCNA